MIHSFRIFHHCVIIVEIHVHGLWMIREDAFLDLLQLPWRVIVGVPSGPPVDAFVDDGVAHDGSGKLWCIDANQEDSLGVTPFLEIFGKEGGVAEFDCDFFCSGFFDEAFQCDDVGKRGWELEQIIMDPIL